MLTVRDQVALQNSKPPIIPSGGVYRSTPITYTDGQGVVNTYDANGNLKVSISGGSAGITDDSAFSVASSTVTPAGYLADETATDSVDEGDIGAPRMTLDRKQITASAYKEDSVFADQSYVTLAGTEIDDPTALAAMTEGDVGNLKGDLAGRLITTHGTLNAGEDITNDLQKVEHRYNYTRVTADTQIKASAGFVHTITISPTTATPTAGLLTVYDNTAESGTIIYSEWVFATTAGHSVTIDSTAGTGIYVGYDGTLANVSCTVSWR